MKQKNTHDEMNIILSYTLFGSYDCLLEPLHMQFWLGCYGKAVVPFHVRTPLGFESTCLLIIVELSDS